VRRGEEAEDGSQRYLGLSHSQPECFGGGEADRHERTKGVFLDPNSGPQALPGSTQATCFELVRRGIGSLTHPRLTIGVGLESIGAQRPVREPIGGKHGDRQAARSAKVSLHCKAFGAQEDAIPKVGPVAMEPAATSSGTVGPFTGETVAANLDREEKPDCARESNPALSTGPRSFAHGRIRHRQALTPTRFPAPLHLGHQERVRRIPRRPYGRRSSGAAHGIPNGAPTRQSSSIGRTSWISSVVGSPMASTTT